MNIRPTKTQDIPALQIVLEGTELFPPEMLEGMFEASQATDPQELFFTYEDNGTAIAFCYAAPEELTNGTWNMLAIAVLPSRQGDGVGAALAAHLEAALKSEGHRILIADTSGTEEFAQTRNFYKKNGYSEESRIRDFWDSGDDKVTFRKALQ
ncbi:GNAT family N-acetyltransferase [Fretibacter rubidus]|uniref:GNAT family N-acetyltransferase n=1 Tax=Fretibacter rubidus TaxID=570162 RepID=UPI00352A0ACD